MSRKRELIHEGSVDVPSVQLHHIPANAPRRFVEVQPNGRYVTCAAGDVDLLFLLEQLHYTVAGNSHTAERSKGTHVGLHENKQGCVNVSRRERLP